MDIKLVSCRPEDPYLDLLNSVDSYHTNEKSTPRTLYEDFWSRYTKTLNCTYT